MEKRFRIYIDESGVHTYDELEASDKRYLGLTGIIIEAESYKTNFHLSLEELKKKHFTYDPDEPVILERSEIINKQGPFWRLRDPAKEQVFNEDLLSFLQSQEYTIITVVIDKKSHLERYIEPLHPYHYCLEVMLERYRAFLYYHHRGAKGDVLAESRGGKEDNLLKEVYQKFYNEGTSELEATELQEVLTSKEIKIKPKLANISGLQVADLLAHPLKQEILLNNGVAVSIGKFAERIYAITKQKYCCHKYTGKIDGYGRKLLK